MQTLNNAEENMPLEEPEPINNETSTINTSEVSGNSNSISNYYQSAEENNNNNNNITIPIQSSDHVFSYESFMFNNSSNNMENYNDDDERLSGNIEIQSNIIRLEYDQYDEWDFQGNGGNH